MWTTTTNRKLSIAAAVMVIGNAAGCSMFSGGGRASMQTIEPPAAQVQANHDPANTDAAANSGAELFDNSSTTETATAPEAKPTPTSINAFGEFDNQPSTAQVKFAPGGFEQVTFVDEGYDADVQVSPDGAWLVFASTRHNERPEIYVQKVGGLSVTQLTCDDADDAFPTFSPDARKIAFASTRNGSWDIYVMDLDGRNVTQVTGSTNMQELHPSFSPCGTKLAYCATGTRSGQWELWTVDLTTTQRRMIGYGLFPVWSPRSDKEQIAFQRARQRGSRWFSLWTADLIDNEARNVTEVAVSANAAIVSPAWNADGTQLAFSTIVNPSTASGTAHKSGRSGTQQDIWVINADGTGRRRITDGNGVNATPTWSHDGRVFFVSDRGGTDAVWSAAAGKPLPIMKAEKNGDGSTDPFANAPAE